jgi:hypothetical protein
MRMRIVAAIALVVAGSLPAFRADAASTPVQLPIHGKVTDPSGAPLAGVCVILETPDPSPANPLYRTTTDGHGEYRVIESQGSPPMQISFDPTCPGGPAFFIKGSWQNGRTVPTGDSNQYLQGENATLIKGGLVTGRLTDARSGAPVSREWVVVSNGSSSTYMFEQDLSGSFSIRVAPGIYQVLFSELGDGAYVDEWYLHQATQAAATPVVVTAGEVTDVSSTLEFGAVVQGVLSDAATGTPLHYEVDAVNDETATAYRGFPDYQGNYRIIGLPSGSYHLRTPGVGSCGGTPPQQYIGADIPVTAQTYTTTTQDIALSCP